MMKFPLYPGIFVVLFSFLFTACAKNHVNDIPVIPPIGEEAHIRLIISTPSSSLPKTRSTDDSHENYVREIQVLVFENGEYSYSAPGLSITNDGIITSFTARLTSTEQPVKLLLIANASTAVTTAEPARGTSEANVRKQLQAAFPDQLLTENLPMFGEHAMPDGITANGINTVSGIVMERSVARVDIELAEYVGDYFTLESVQLFRVNDALRLIPDTGSDQPAVPEGATPVNINELSIINNTSKAQLYLPESHAQPESDRLRKATCVVVGGSYRGGPVSYYRMDFNITDLENFGQVMRNYRYIFRIDRVSGQGWYTPEDAANNLSTKLEVTIKEWNDETSYMEFDGYNYFGVSERTLTMRYKKNTQKQLFIDTDLDEYKMYWADDSGQPVGQPSNLLENSDFHIEKSADGTHITVTAINYNPVFAASDRACKIALVASRFVIPVTIRQEIRDNFTRKSVNLLSFSEGLGSLGTSHLSNSNTGADRGRAFRGILLNQDNFGPSGIVRISGFNLMHVSGTNVTRELLDAVDIVYVHYMATSVINSTRASLIHEWVKADPNRVLIVSMDATDVSQNMLAEVLPNKNNDIVYYRTWWSNYYTTLDEQFLTGEGPFTAAPIASGTPYRCYDEYYGAIRSGSTSSIGITPVLKDSGGDILLGIDHSRRIIYCGDVDLFAAIAGTHGNTSERQYYIDNITGNLNSDNARLIANMSAWMVDVVLSGN